MPKPCVGALHRLAPARRAATPEAVARSLVALHATDPTSVHLAVAARTAGAGTPVADIDRALYGERTIVRVMGMRRTLWAVPADLVPVVAAACGRDVAAAERRRLVQLVEAQGLADDGAVFVAGLEEQMLAALAERGEALSAELSADVPGLKATVRVGGESKWATDASLASRVLVLLTCEGRIARAQPPGAWTSTRVRYAPAPAAGPPLGTAEARAELARRWLAAFGPASDDPVADLKWWAGWTVAATRAALAAAGEPESEAEPEPGPASAAGGAEGCEGWAALVPSLDPTTMGWKQRSWYLGELGPRLFDRNGNAGPAIWWDGRVVGGWAQRASGEVVTRLLVDVGREGSAAVEAEAARIQAWLDASGGVVRPRFPTPLQTELAS